MSVRLSVLPQGLRHSLALIMTALSIALPAALVWLSAGGLAERWSARTALAGEVAALSEAVSEASTAPGPAGAHLSPAAAAAEAALERRADALAAAFEAAGAALIARDAAQARDVAGVSERRLTLVAAGSPDALAAALAAAARDPALAVSFAEFDSPREDTARVRLTLVEVIGPEASP